VIRALRDEATFETRVAANEVLKSSGVKISSLAGRAAVAKELSLDYVVWGRMRGRGSSTRADIRIAGSKGKEIAAQEAGPPGQTKGNARIQQAMRALLTKALEVAPPGRRAPKAVPVVAATAAEPKSPTPATSDSKPLATTLEVEAIQIKTQTTKARYGPILNILGGAGGRTRTITINVEDSAGGTATRKYESGAYLDIVFRLELRPLARHLTKGLRGLAVEADGDFAIGLQTETQGSTAKLDTKAWRVLGQIGYFYGLGKHEVGGLLGIGFDRLAIEDNGTLPSIQYLFLRLGPAYRYFFIERTLYLRVDGGFRFPFSYGDLSDAFGDAKGFGFDAGLMIGGELNVGFSYALRVSFDYFKPQFSGFPGGMLPSLPAAAQGLDGTDLAISFHAMLGWSF
jgi:hypothetical protein